jgi:DNA-binding IscR family transcriptional regulator
MKPENCNTIYDVRKFCEDNSDHPITAAWTDMLYDMDEFGEDYTVEDFLDELEQQRVLGKV